jgi:hypothetical protein
MEKPNTSIGIMLSESEPETNVTMSTKQLKKQEAAELQTLDANIISSIVINGDISKLSPQQKVEYYRSFCERLGLDPISQPFKLLRLNGKEVLYCDRSGAQQLNKLHKVSHRIVNRETINGCFAVTAQASTPDGRVTESIGAVNVEGLKGEAFCNALMKAETKAKRRATLDLLGLGILDESETDSIPGAVREPYVGVGKGAGVTVQEVAAEEVDGLETWKDEVNKCASKEELGALYKQNENVVKSNPQLLNLFTERKQQLAA